VAGKGIILMHDIKRSTAAALPTILRQLKANGFKVVHLVPKDPATSLAPFDQLADHLIADYDLRVGRTRTPMAGLTGNDLTKPASLTTTPLGDGEAQPASGELKSLATVPPQPGSAPGVSATTSIGDRLVSRQRPASNLRDVQAYRDLDHGGSAASHAHDRRRKLCKLAAHHVVGSICANAALRSQAVDSHRRQALLSCSHRRRRFSHQFTARNCSTIPATSHNRAIRLPPARSQLELRVHGNGDLAKSRTLYTKRLL
jgi:hypothetical protein